MASRHTRFNDEMPGNAILDKVHENLDFTRAFQASSPKLRLASLTLR